MAQDILNYVDGTGAPGTFSVDKTAGKTTPYTALSLSGVPVATGNPIPVADAALLAALAASATAANQASEIAQQAASASALGTVSDPVWAGTGSGTVVASLKAIWAKLAGTLSVGLAAGTNLAGGFTLADGVNGTVRASVSQFHNVDDQLLPNTAQGLLTGGVAQLINTSGGVDRQRSTGSDNISATGIATGTAQLRSRIVTSSASAATVGGTTLTLTGTKFTNRGVAAWIQVGSVLTLEPGAVNQEQVRVATLNYGANTVTITGQGTGRGFALAHASGVVVSSSSYNESLDSTLPDGSPPSGIQAGGAYLFNAASNGKAGGVEFERSFAGELMLATGVGAAIAAEYEDTGGGPLLANGTPSGMRLMPAQALMGVNLAAGPVTATAVGAMSLVFSSAAAAASMTPGHAIQLSGGAVMETVVTDVGWVPGSSATVPLQSPVVNAGQVTARWSIFAPNGPGLTGFLPHGIGLEEECVYDPVTNLYYLERAATQDGVSPQNVVMESVALWNGVSLDRMPGSALRGTDVNARSGFNASYNLSAAAVVKGTPGRAVRVSVLVAGTTAGSVNDCATTGAAAVSNQVAVIPNVVGVVLLDWPHQTGIVVVPGTGQVLAVAYT